MSVTISLSSTDLSELFAEFGQQAKTVPEFSSSELALSWSARVGKGHCRTVELLRGFTLFERMGCKRASVSKHEERVIRVAKKSAAGRKKSAPGSFRGRQYRDTAL